MKFILTLLALFIGQSAVEQSVSTNNLIMKNDITDIWDYYESNDLLALLENAQQGDDKDLDTFVQRFAPFTAVSGNQSKLWVLWPFRITPYERQLLNRRLDDDDFWWRLTLVSRGNGHGSLSYFRLPDKLTFSGLQVNDTTINLFMNDGTSIATNEAELFFKLFPKDKPADIDRAFASLCNQQYPEPVSISPMDLPVKQPFYDRELIYNDEFRWYEGQTEIANRTVNVYLHAESSEELERLLVIADKRLSEKFYEAAMRQMEKDMFHHKNDLWLDEDEDPLTEEMFKNRISLSEIAFNKDGSCTIYCDDDGIFHWHTVSIDIDTAGNYLGSGL